MSFLHQLATEVLLGTERRMPTLPALPGALGELLALVANDDACPQESAVETRVLRCAGVLAACAAAGYLPPVAQQPLPAVCPPETLPPVSDATLAFALQQILASGFDSLRREALLLLADAGHCLPPRLLPRALGLGQKLPALRAALLPVLGRRGEWLARQESAWAWAVGGLDPAPDMGLWEHGTLEQRKQFLAKLRSSDPAQARSLLQAGLDEFDARERVGLLEQFAVGLGAADEDFLESLLADRSKEARQLAASLLSRIPNSRYLARMAARMAACLGKERKLFRQVHTLEAPTQFGADWKADALEEVRTKSESLGERAWWLYQVARSLPLRWWQAQTGMQPAELIAWPQSTDWAEAILRAWHGALQRDGDAEWAAAFLDSAVLNKLAFDVFALLNNLPMAEREQRWLRMLDPAERRMPLGDLLLRFVEGASLHSPQSPGVSADFARRVLGEVRQALPSDACKYDYALRKALPEFICLIPPSCLEEAGQDWPMGRAETEYFSETLAAMLAIVAQRKTLYRTLCLRKSP